MYKFRLSFKYNNCISMNIIQMYLPRKSAKDQMRRIGNVICMPPTRKIKNNVIL